ncbi:MAG TPA: TadE family protein [Polyangiaceae bacterium]|nr:TadE family protein [Polyangiaceae bacterium]
MARLVRVAHPDAALVPDQRGVVYVEFLIAFFPLFILFFSVCQLALIASARLVVEHAAQSAVRTAIVILDEPPADFGDAPRGFLSQGQPNPASSAEALLSALGVDIQEPSDALAADIASAGVNSAIGATGGEQAGARMVPIRTAAYFPLLALAPRPSTLLGTDAQSLGDGLPEGFGSRMQFGLEFLRAAAVVTVHDGPAAEALAAEPVEPKAPVTVRVTYLFHCAVPLARILVCDSLLSLLTPETSLFGLSLPTGKRAALIRRLKLAEAPGALQKLANPASRFAVLTAEATLPNQGARYYQPEEKTQ